MNGDGSVCALAWRGGAAALAIRLIAFDGARFDAGSFGAAGIDCPAPIARSLAKRQAEYFYGRLCARAALAQWRMDHYAVGSGAMGEPLWPSGLVGSITHTRRMAACVVAPASQFQGIGIDLEIIGDASLLESMAGIVVSDQELTRLRACGRDLGLALSLVFSAKEAFYKGIFHLVRRFVDFGALELLQIDFGARLIRCEIRETLHARLPRGCPVQIEFEVRDDHVVTLFRCSEGVTGCAGSEVWEKAPKKEVLT